MTLLTSLQNKKQVWSHCLLDFLDKFRFSESPVFSFLLLIRMWKIDKKLNFRNYQTESYASLTLRGIQAFFAASFPFRHFRRQHVLRTVCLAGRLLSSKAHNTRQTFRLSNLEFCPFPMEVTICCTMEIYNKGSDISSCPNTTYKNLHHLPP